MQVLLVEDDDSIAEPLVSGLEREGYDVTRVGAGQPALDHVADHPVDLVLLDLGLPDIDGYEVCRRIRAGSDVPIICVTARGEEVDRIVGLELGADDYLVKPFGFRELVARIRAVTRRSQGRVERSATVQIRSVTLDVRAHRVTVDGTPVPLSPKEFDLLAMLAEDPGATRTRTEILEQVWDAHWYGPTRTLDVHVASLRKKLGDPDIIETVRGVGFRLGVDAAP